MKAKTKILILGIGQSNFLNQLYGEVTKRNNSFSFGITNFFDISRGKTEKDLSIYDDFISLNYRFGKFKSLQCFIAFLFTSFFWEILFFEKSQNKSLIEIARILHRYSKSRDIVKSKILPLKYDIYHFHFCTPENLMFLQFLPDNCKSICSFWGSDLMRVTGVSNVFYVAKALKKATKITIQTEEMAEMLYCKYGRELSNKLKVLRFTIETDIFNEISHQKTNDLSRIEFGKKYGIPESYFIVALGHNGFEENNHLKMIKQLKKLPKTILDSTSFLLHMGYGGNPTYKSKLIEYASKEKEINLVPIMDYFGPQQIAQLRIATDLLVQMPVSDALSGAMTEVLYAGNVVIAGAWLPYGIFRRWGIRYFEINSFSDLPDKIEYVFNNLQEIKTGNSVNKNYIKSFLFPDTTSNDWINLFANCNE